MFTSVVMMSYMLMKHYANMLVFITSFNKVYIRRSI